MELQRDLRTAVSASRATATAAAGPSAVQRHASSSPMPAAGGASRRNLRRRATCRLAFARRGPRSRLHRATTRSRRPPPRSRPGWRGAAARGLGAPALQPPRPTARSVQQRSPGDRQERSAGPGEPVVRLRRSPARAVLAPLHLTRAAQRCFSGSHRLLVGCTPWPAALALPPATAAGGSLSLVSAGSPARPRSSPVWPVPPTPPRHQVANLAREPPRVLPMTLYCWSRRRRCRSATEAGLSWPTARGTLARWQRPCRSSSDVLRPSPCVTRSGRLSQQCYLTGSVVSSTWVSATSTNARPLCGSPLPAGRRRLFEHPP